MDKHNWPTGIAYPFQWAVCVVVWGGLLCLARHWKLL